MSAGSLPAVGIVVLAHGDSASALLAAARAILGADALPGVIALDAGQGETPELSSAVCDAIAEEDEGRGVLLLLDLVGASPFWCAQRGGKGHQCHTLGGLNLAMLLKLASLDRKEFDAEELAHKLADSGRRAVTLADPPSGDPETET